MLFKPKEPLTKPSLPPEITINKSFAQPNILPLRMYEPQNHENVEIGHEIHLESNPHISLVLGFVILRRYLFYKLVKLNMSGKRYSKVV